MYLKLHSTVIQGVEGKEISIEIDLTRGLPAFGIAGGSVRDAHVAADTIRSAVKNSGFTFPNRKLRVSLSPPDSRKSIDGLQLAIAAGVIYLTTLHKDLLKKQQIWMHGRVNLEGKISEAPGLFQFLEWVAKKGNGKECVVVPESAERYLHFFPKLKVHLVSSLNEAIYPFTGQLRTITANSVPQFAKEPPSDKTRIKAINSITGHTFTKRALQIAAAGNHHILILGPTGVGKSLLGRALHHLLPPRDKSEEQLLQKIRSITGDSSHRPFIEITPAASVAAITGNCEKLGFATKATKGVLFIDEIGQLNTKQRLALLKILDDRVVQIDKQCILPADFLLVLATTLCPCGRFGSFKNSCTCTSAQQRSYLKKLTPPLLSRIDMVVRLTPPEFESDAKVSTDYIKAIDSAKRIQLKRFEKSPYTSNSELELKDTELLADLDINAKKKLEEAKEKFDFSLRDVVKCIRVCRTIADLEGEKRVKVEHLLEALSYRYNFETD